MAKLLRLVGEEEKEKEEEKKIEVWLDQLAAMQDVQMQRHIYLSIFIDDNLRSDNFLLKGGFVTLSNRLEMYAIFASEIGIEIWMQPSRYVQALIDFNYAIIAMFSELVCN